ncbi:Polyubiquitin 9 [Trichinella zimbabwensis]|uniref:Polyubiquitin 9 n=1 Tax=Trichinella zimbabwensis TaxID=268475 RepID=A0A0V1HRB7_9BILA|nr:Polyubiquitin 9 [Trichinella zimbabwensis]
MEKNSEEIAIIPKGDLWLNCPCLRDQVTNMQIINTGNRPLAWQLSSNHDERYQFMPSRGSLLVNGSVKVCITVKAFPLEAEELELIDDEIIVHWVEDREQHAKFNPKLFDNANANLKQINTILPDWRLNERCVVECREMLLTRQTIRVNKRNSCHAFQRARPHRQPMMIKPKSSRPAPIVFLFICLFVFFLYFPFTTFAFTVESENHFHSQLTNALCLGTERGDADGRHGSILLNLNNQRAKQQIQTGSPTQPNNWRRYAREQPENENAFKSIAAKFVPAPQTTETTAYHSANQIQLVTVTSSVAISNSIGDHFNHLQKSLIIESLTGLRISLVMSSSDLIVNIKQRIADLQGVATASQCLIFNGQELNDLQTLDSAGILNGSFIRLVLRSRSGPMSIVAISRSPTANSALCTNTPKNGNTKEKSEVDKPEVTKRLMFKPGTFLEDEEDAPCSYLNSEHKKDSGRSTQDSTRTIERIRVLRSVMDRMRLQRMHKRTQAMTAAESVKPAFSWQGVNRPLYLRAALNPDDTSAKESSAGETEFEEGSEFFGIGEKLPSSRLPLRFKTGEGKRSYMNSGARFLRSNFSDGSLYSSCSENEQDSSQPSSTYFKLSKSTADRGDQVYYKSRGTAAYNRKCGRCCSDDGRCCEYNVELPRTSNYWVRTPNAVHKYTKDEADDLDDAASDPSDFSSDMVVAHVYRRCKVRRRVHSSKPSHKRAEEPTSEELLEHGNEESSGNSSNFIDCRLMVHLRTKALRSAASSGGKDSSPCDSSSDEMDSLYSERFLNGVCSALERSRLTPFRKYNTADGSVTASTSTGVSNVVRTRKLPQSSQSQQPQCRCGKTLCGRHKSAKLHHCMDSRVVAEARHYPVDTQADRSSDSDLVPHKATLQPALRRISLSTLNGLPWPGKMTSLMQRMVRRLSCCACGKVEKHIDRHYINNWHTCNCNGSIAVYIFYHQRQVRSSVARSWIQLAVFTKANIFTWTILKLSVDIFKFSNFMYQG